MFRESKPEHVRRTSGIIRVRRSVNVYATFCYIFHTNKSTVIVYSDFSGILLVIENDFPRIWARMTDTLVHRTAATAFATKTYG